MNGWQKNHRGFSTLELLAVVSIAAIIGALALPSGLTALQGYRLHSDASAIAGVFNVARMRAAAQYAPYRLNIATNAGTYTMEKLCGNTPATVDSACTSAYASFTTPQIESGTQYATQGDTFSSCRPAGITAYAGTLTADPSGCPASLQFYFNTRGAAVDSSGTPLSNGGTVLYITNQNNLVDAVAVSVGGQVTVWNWSSSSTQWYLR